MALVPIVPAYTIVQPDQTKDRRFYQIIRPARNPNGNRRHVYWENTADGPHVIYYDTDGKPSDVGYQISLLSRQKLVTRRKTPRVSDVLMD
jgi:hypothetical protein